MPITGAGDVPLLAREDGSATEGLTTRQLRRQREGFAWVARQQRDSYDYCDFLNARMLRPHTFS